MQENCDHYIYRNAMKDKDKFKNDVSLRMVDGLMCTYTIKNALAGLPSVGTLELKGKIERKFQEKTWFTIDGLHSFIPEISRTLLYEILSDELGYDNFVHGG